MGTLGCNLPQGCNNEPWVAEGVDVEQLISFV